jgi:chromosome partitioning protein
MTIVCVAGTKGGVGKTTTAVCLAQEAAGRGLDTLLLDLDPQGTAAEWAPELAKQLARVHSPLEIQQAAGTHALVLLDTAPGAGPTTIAAIEAADIVVAVTGLGPGEMRGLQHLLRVVDPDLIIPTRFDARRSMHRWGLDALRTRWAGLTTDPVPMAAVVERAQADQDALPLLSRPAIAYREILDRLLTLMGAH